MSGHILILILGVSSLAGMACALKIGFVYGCNLTRLRMERDGKLPEPKP